MTSLPFSLYSNQHFKADGRNGIDLVRIRHGRAGLIFRRCQHGFAKGGRSKIAQNLAPRPRVTRPGRITDGGGVYECAGDFGLATGRTQSHCDDVVECQVLKGADKPVN